MDEDQYLQADLDGEGESEQFELPTDDAIASEATGDEPGEGAEDPSVDIDGKQYKQSQIRELIKSGMLEKDYRQKTTQLAREREQLAPLRQAAEAWQTIYQHPKLRQVVAAAIADVLQGKEPTYGAAPAAETEREFPLGQPEGEEQPWKGELTKLQEGMGKTVGTLEQRLKQYEDYQWKTYYAQRENYARTHLPTLQQKYPYLYPDEIVGVFRDQKDADLEELAKASHEHWYKFAQERQKADMAKRKENAKARVDAGAARGGAPATQTVEPGDWDAASRSARERLRKVGQLFGR